ncbi:cytochrome b5 reductase 4 isoform X1 [Bacillus rossius redtenbacheri]|uniref:cytochrome b5 reductase 4 isoform X1 n=1 Tax=Bacillus rossius redtenbacheri TaxID=93214 RepID=UPI002FDE2D83
MEPSDLKQSEDTQRDIFASSKNITETVSSLKLQGTSESLPTSSSSATGNVRNKVSLKPGHSLMDWIRLGQSGIDLTGVKGVLQEVTPSQLARHNKRSDAWLAIRGRVYNVTRYMDFHPGGAEELMKGVGRDATQLFNQVHAWVNFESLLQKCQVGHLRKSESSRLPDLGLLLFKSKKNSKETLNNKPNYSSDNTASAGNPSAEKSSSGRASVPLDWFQTTDSLTLVYYTRSPCPWVDVQLKDSADLTVSVAAGEDRLLSRVRLEGEVSWPCGVVANADTGKVDVRLRKKCARLWRGLGSVCTDDSAPSAAGLFAAWRVVEVLPVTHDTRLIVLRHPDNVHRVVPVGHHVRVRSNIQGTEVVRSYTPVPPCLPCRAPPPPACWADDCLCLMVKEYSGGALSPWLCGRAPGDSLELSGPAGSFSACLLRGAAQLCLVAAGTGVTPMLGLIAWALRARGNMCRRINLMFFNRTQKDILWRDQLDKLQEMDDRFTVVYRLSEPDDSWSGQRGRVDKACLESFVPNISANKELFVCICGPDAFTELTGRLLDELGCPRNQYHCFHG